MSDQDINRIIGMITKKVLIVLLPSVLLLGGADWAKTHYTMKNKVDRVDFLRGHAEVVLLIEKKTRAIESLSKGNKEDIIEMKQLIREIDGYQHEIDKYLREHYRVRGNSSLPEY